MQAPDQDRLLVEGVDAGPARGAVARVEPRLEAPHGGPGEAAHHREMHLHAGTVVGQEVGRPGQRQHEVGALVEDGGRGAARTIDDEHGDAAAAQALDPRREGLHARGGAAPGGERRDDAVEHEQVELGRQQGFHRRESLLAAEIGQPRARGRERAQGVGRAGADAGGGEPCARPEGGEAQPGIDMEHAQRPRSTPAEHRAAARRGIGERQRQPALAEADRATDHGEPACGDDRIDEGRRLRRCRLDRARVEQHALLLRRTAACVGHGGSP